MQRRTTTNAASSKSRTPASNPETPEESFITIVSKALPFGKKATEVTDES